MKLLDALVPRSQPSQEISRYSLSDYLQMVMQFGGLGDPLGYRTTYGDMPAEPIGETFVDYIHNAYRSSGVVFACQLVRLKVFAEARFQWQRMRGGRPGELFGLEDLALLERPWPGGTTGDLLARMILDADLAGNWFGTVIDGEVVRLRPDWTDIVLAPRIGPNGGTVGMRRVGYVYYEGGRDNQSTGLATKSGSDPEPFQVDEVAHFAPYPDPLAQYRGMSWITPIVREIQGDVQATRHKVKFFENGATPNVVISLPQAMTPTQFNEYVDMTNDAHKGVENAYKTWFLAGGADATVIGSDMRQLDFKSTTGAGETRIANAAGVHPAVVGLSEGMQGSSLNAGNFNSAKRQTAQTTFRPLWRNASGSLETLVPPPEDGSRLWYDDRDIEFLREDEKDAAEIRASDAQTMRTLLDAGYQPDAAVEYVASGEVTRLRGQHSGLFSVQLQPPGSSDPEAAAVEAADEQLALPVGSNNGSSGG
jgi:hypothetical protein